MKASQTEALIRSLNGIELDKYGQAIGIPRYQGLFGPELDASYRDHIRKEMFQKIDDRNISSSNSSKEFLQSSLYAVVEIDERDGRIIEICKWGPRSGAYALDADKDNCDLVSSLKEWEKARPADTFEIRKVGFYVEK